MDLFLQLISSSIALIFTLTLLYNALLKRSTKSILVSKNTSNKAPEPDGAWPIIGHLHLLGGGDQLLYRTLGAMADKYGPAFTIRLGSRNAIVVSSCEVAKECFTINDKALASRPMTAAAKHMGYNYAVFGFAPYSSFWREMRKISTLELLSNRRLEVLKHVRTSEVDMGVRELYNLWTTNNSRPVLVELKSWFEDLTLNVVVRMVAGKRYFGASAATTCDDDRDEARQCQRAINKFFHLIGIFTVSDALPFLWWLDLQGHEKAMKKTAKELDAILEGWLEEHRQRRLSGGIKSEDEQDFIDVMLSLEEEGQLSNFQYDSNIGIKSTCLAIILGGSDTSAGTLTWAVSLLLNNPHMLKKAQEELDQLVGMERQVNESDIKNLVYLQAIIKETLRLYPAGPLLGPREAMEDCTVNGYRVAAGTRLIVNVWKIQRDPRVWTNPSAFQPERFLTSHPHVDVRGQQFELIPFGSGRRSCPGASFALQVLHLTLARLLHGFDISTPLIDQPVDMTESPGLTIPKATPLENPEIQFNVGGAEPRIQITNQNQTLATRTSLNLKYKASRQLFTDFNKVLDSFNLHIINEKKASENNQKHHAMDFLLISSQITETSVLAAIIASVIILCSLLLTNRSKLKREAPEAGGAWPVVGHLHLLGGPEPAHRVLGNMADKYGPIFTVKMGVHRALVVSNWEIAKECLTTNDKVFANRPKTMAMEILGYNFSIIGFSPYGPYWRQARKIATLELLSNHQLEKLKHVREYEMKTSLKELYELWAKKRSHCSNKVLIEMNRWFEDATLNVILKLIVGKRCGAQEGEEISGCWKEELTSFFKLSGKFLVSDALPFLRWLDIGGDEKSMKKIAKELDIVVQEWLEEHKKKRASGETKEDEDFMDVMMTILQYHAQLFPGRDVDTTMILAATDTTTVTLTWALTLLLNHRDILKNAQNELDTQVGSERQVKESDIKNLVYLQAILKETMRLYPAGPLSIPHESMQDCTVSGYHIPAQTRLLVNLWKIHRDPTVWSDPCEFQPERFLTTHKDFDVRGQNYEYMPFSSGRRMCPGVSFALQVSQLTLASLIHGFDFETQSNEEEVDTSEGIGLTFVKAIPLQVLLSPRLSTSLYA
ncbi:hypothetical protein Dsin_003384 [Dipteronia sinensis]|uniref:Cytochrome P450 n=1 Tax=Dipteronia sinensis TaxID=43782 RepID=A0AAE0EK67_9ROSI|nr:hypothetical protein Dsin_003384 [Dipteronia sinensis]